MNEGLWSEGGFVDSENTCKVREGLWSEGGYVE